MKIALNQFEPPLNRLGVPIGSIEAGIHDRTQMHVQPDVHAYAD